MTGEMLIELEQVLLKEKPDWVIIFGDTNSTLAAAIAASKLQIKIAHIEAGLRSFNMSMPEELNRILTDRISSILFCPTDQAVENLNREGFSFFDCSVHKVGDIMKDGALYYSKLAKPPANFNTTSSFNLVTVHRAENTDDEFKIKSIFCALNKIGKTTRLVLPLHPRTKQSIEKLNIEVNHIELIEPLGYLEMLWMIANCTKILTDSGGLQKEAFFFSKPCITLREETEWIELVENNFNVLTGSDQLKIIQAFDQHEFNTDFEMNLYGGDHIANTIVSILKKY